MESINPQKLAESIVPLICLFPNLAEENIVEDLDEEWRTMVQQDNVSNNLELEKFWDNIFSRKNALNEFMFPRIRDFIGSILSFPHSSATAERIFSHLNNIKNKNRNCLHTESVNAILMSKELLNKNSCEKWVPSKNLIAKYHKRIMTK